MEYIVLSALNAASLTSKVNRMIEEGWKPVGSHVVTEHERQNRYSGTQHMDTICKHEYSQTMIKVTVSRKKAVNEALKNLIG